MSNLFKPKVANPNCAEVEPVEAWEILKNNKDSYLIDVRTNVETTFIGFPSLVSLSKEVIFVPWRHYPNMEVNEDFVSQVRNSSDSINDNSSLFFLCKIGQRSLDAANEFASNGFTKCFNIIGGFEGRLDNNGQRANVEGWKKFNLPWEQR